MVISVTHCTVFNVWTLRSHADFVTVSTQSPKKKTENQKIQLF